LKSIRLGRSSAETPTTIFKCPSCGRKTPGKFCGSCGEKQICDEDYSIRHYLKEIILALTPLQSKLMRTLWLVASKPGFLSCETPDAGVGTIDPTFDGGVQSLNPLFACSPLLSATTSSYRIKILQNDIVYGAAVVAIDNSGNASTPDIFYGVPIKTKSFYDVYRNDDPDHPGGASGGLCTLGTGSTSGGAIAGACGALALIAIVLARRGRGGRRK